MEKFVTKKGALTEYIGSKEIVKLPYRVKRIKQLAFFSHESMKEIVLTKYVEQIDEDDEKVKTFALEVENVKRNMEGKELKKIIVVKNKIVNIVAI